MAPRIRVFDTDPDAAPKPRPVSDIVGRFRSGKQEAGNPVALDAWRVTTGDPDVAAAIASRMGGEVAEWDTEKEDNLEVETDKAAVKVIISGTDAVEFDLKLWNQGELIHHCDGVAYLSSDAPEEIGQPCGCPESFADRKDLAKRKRGPRPDTRVVFRLADAPELGKFEMRSGSWDLVRALPEYLNAMEDADDEGNGVTATLKLEEVAFIAKSGPRKGKPVTYKKPTLTGYKPYNGPALDDDGYGEEPPF